MELKIIEEPNASPFVNAPFCLRVVLVDSTDGHQHSGTSVPLTVTLVDEEGTPIKARTKGSSLLTVNAGRGQPKVAIAASSGDVVLTIVIKDTSVQHNNTPFYLRVAPSSGRSPIAAVVTKVGMTVIRYKLKIINMSGIERNPKNGEALFFKDEGGQDKMVSVDASLLDASGEPVTGLTGADEVPISVELTYTDGSAVRDTMKCLKLNHKGSSKSSSSATGDATRIGSNGRIHLEFRLQDVSKNHGNQGFRIRLAPNLVAKPDAHGLGAVATEPICVRSKRNKKKPSKRRAVVVDAVMMGGGPARKRQALGADALTTPRTSAAAAAAIKASAVHSNVDVQVAMTQVVRWTHSVVQTARTMQQLLDNYDTQIMPLLGTVMDVVHQYGSSTGAAAAAAASSSSSSSSAGGVGRGSAATAGVPRLEPMASNESAASPRTQMLLSELRASSSEGTNPQNIFDGLESVPGRMMQFASVALAVPELKRQASHLFMQTQAGQAFVRSDSMVAFIHARKVEAYGLPAFDASDVVRCVCVCFVCVPDMEYSEVNAVHWCFASHPLLTTHTHSLSLSSSSVLPPHLSLCSSLVSTTRTIRGVRSIPLQHAPR